MSFNKLIKFVSQKPWEFIYFFHSFFNNLFSLQLSISSEFKTFPFRLEITAKIQFESLVRNCLYKCVKYKIKFLEKVQHEFRVFFSSTFCVNCNLWFCTVICTSVIIKTDIWCLFPIFFYPQSKHTVLLISIVKLALSFSFWHSWLKLLKNWLCD